MKIRREISFPTVAGMRLRGELALPKKSRALVVFVHGSGTTRHDAHNERVAHTLQKSGCATLLVDLLDDYESRERHNVFDVDMQAQRLVEVVRWLRAAEPRCERLPTGYFGAGVGAGVVLIAAARAPGLVQAIVSRGGRPDTASEWLARVQAPTLFIADEAGVTPDWVAAAFDGCAAPKERAFIDSPSHLYKEPEAIEALAQQAARWFARYLIQIKRRSAEPGIMRA